MCGNEFLVQRSNRFWVGNQVLTVKRKREEYQANCVMSSDTRQLMMPSEFESHYLQIRNEIVPKVMEFDRRNHLWVHLADLR